MNLFDKFSSVENLENAFDYFVEESEKTYFPLDPLSHPTKSIINKSRATFFPKLSEYLRSVEYQPDPADCIYVPKRNFGVRPLAILSTTDKIIYQALLNPNVLGGIIEDRMLDCCYGNRVDGNKSYLYDWKSQWHKYYDSQIKAFEKGFVHYIEFDINCFFNSISIPKLKEILKNDFKINDSEVLILIEKLLTTWSDSDSNSGIPQSSESSSVLANAYLYPLDKYLNSRNKEDFRYFRYNDDMVIMTKDENILDDIVYKISIFLQKYNLNLNQKTRIEKLKNTDIIKEKKFFEEYGNAFINSESKISSIKEDLPGIFKKIFERKENKSDLGKLSYYLKADSNNELIWKVINLIPKLSQYIPFVVRYLERFIDEQFVFEEVWGIYKKNKLKDWDKFWILKLLLSSNCSVRHEEFQAEIEKLEKGNDGYLIKISILYYKINRFDSTIKNDYIRNLLESSKSVVEKTNYLYLSLFSENKLRAGVLNDFLKENSVDIQIVAMAFVNYYKYKKKLDLSTANSFSKIYFGFFDNKEKINRKNNKSNEVLICDSQFSVIEDILEEVKNSSIEKTLGTEKRKQSSEDKLFIKLKNNKLEINKNTGFVKLNKVKQSLNPTSREFKALIKIATAKDYKATYEDLIDNKTTKVNIRNLGFVIRNLKEALGILPKKTAQNKDIVKNIRKHGYRLLVE